MSQQPPGILCQIRSSRESNPSRRVSNLRAVPVAMSLTKRKCFNQHTTFVFQYSPITPRMCREERKFRKLRSCYLMLKDKETLRQHSLMFLSQMNYWRESSKYAQFVGDSRKISYLSRPLSSSSVNFTSREMNQLLKINSIL